jgi:putative membrane protein
MHAVDGPFWGMHLFWWGFWIFAMISIFGFNVPDRTRIYSLDPHAILKRRLAKGEINEAQYKQISAQLKVDESSAVKELTAQTNHLKVVGHPIVDGLSFSTTWAVFYSICALLYVVAPSAVLIATSKLFHGMSFTQMAQAGTTFTLGDFFAVLTIGAGYAFVAGIVWSFTHSYFLGQSAGRKLKRTESRTVQKSQLNPQSR